MDEAVGIARTEFASDSPQTAACLNNAASLLLKLGRGAEAEARAREGLEIRQRTLPADNPSIGSSQLVLGRILVAAGRAAEAEPILRAAIERWGAIFPPTSSPMAEIQGVLGECLLDQGKLDEATPLLEGSDDSVRKNSRASATDRREAIERLIRLAEACKDPSRAAALRADLAQLDPPR
ncbi:MAG: tetratricopeptide repeat protein [Phycisphaerales bacterium]|nr:tetratricopeptide repeat protein [Phycisphaerales bacterium]